MNELYVDNIHWPQGCGDGVLVNAAIVDEFVETSTRLHDEVRRAHGDYHAPACPICQALATMDTLLVKVTAKR